VTSTHLSCASNATCSKQSYKNFFKEEEIILFYNLTASENGIAYLEQWLGYEMEHQRFKLVFAAGERNFSHTRSV
jgi:hypothetical protein